MNESHWYSHQQQTAGSKPKRIAAMKHNRPLQERQNMKQSFKTRIGLALSASALVLLSGAALAQSASADGIVRKIDANSGRVIIKHGDWQGMNMSAMTMAFNVGDKALLNGIKVDDVVRFSIRKEGRDYVITDMKRSPAQVATASGRPSNQ
jgi:Cu/Ag efflux protein CusF